MEPPGSAMRKDLVRRTQDGESWAKARNMRQGVGKATPHPQLVGALCFRLHSPLWHEAGMGETLPLPGQSGFYPPLDPVNSSSSVASRQRMGLVWPSAMETHCSGAVLAPLAPPTGVMTPLPRREGEREHLSAREPEARLSEVHR